MVILQSGHSSEITRAPSLRPTDVRFQRPRRTERALFFSTISSINGFFCSRCHARNIWLYCRAVKHYSGNDGCQNRVTTRRGLLQVVMKMDSGRCSQTHLSIVAVSIVIQRHEMNMTKISLNFSLCSFFLRNHTSILIKELCQMGSRLWYGSGPR